MSSSRVVEAVSAFIEGAPPGELTDVINDIKVIAAEHPSILDKGRPALVQYAEEQLVEASLPGKSQKVLISSYNRLSEGEYYDPFVKVSYKYDPLKQNIIDQNSYTSTTGDSELISSLHKALSLHASEHYPSSTIAVIPTPSSSTLTLLLAANKYSPSNFWSGRLRTIYTYDPSSSLLSGAIKVDVHYYEDGNVRLTTSKSVSETKVQGGTTAAAVVREVARIERKYHEELNRGFTQLNEGAFKALRRPLPVTRQKMEWEKISSYRAGRDIGGLRR